jgi:hypothetical protein
MSEGHNSVKVPRDNLKYAAAHLSKRKRRNGHNPYRNSYQVPVDVQLEA